MLRVPHPFLEQLTGSWSVRMTTWSEDGTATRGDGLRAGVSLFGDGRYAREDLAGEFGGKRHEKLTLLGWNATRARFEYVTADNHDGVLMFYTTSPDRLGAERAIELFADYAAPAETNADGPASFITIRTVITIEDAKRRTLRNFYKPGGQPERPFLEYIYLREE